MSAVAWKEELLSSRKVCKTDPAKMVESLVESKRRMAKQIKRMGLEGNWQANQTAQHKLTNLFYSNWLGAHYPLVDLSFADSKIKLLIKRSSEGAHIVGLCDRDAEPPTEMTVSVSKYARQTDEARGRELFSSFPDPKHALGRFIFPKFQLNREQFRSYDGTVNCNRPDGSPKSLCRKFRDVAAIGLEARAAAIRGGTSVEGPSYGRLFLWEPRIEDLYIEETIPVRDDPAVLVTLGDRAHLIAFWDSPEENPIEGILREFSEGSFDNVAD